jgi:uncharacterized damage-inducible protein DinB
MTAEQARAVAESVGQQLQNEWMTTYKVIKAVPEDKTDYRPEPHSRSAGELANHLGTADFFFLDAVINGSFGAFKEPEPAASMAALAEAYKHEFPKRLEAVLALEGTHLAREIEFAGMMQPAAHFLVFTLAHMVHHRGQLSTYLRPMGGKVPSIYGGSYDEPWQG